MKVFLLLLLSFATAFCANAQSVIYQRADSVIIMKQGGYAELVIRNRTKDTLGILLNTGNGIVKFSRSKTLNDSTFVIGNDTLVIRGSVSSGGGGGGSMDSTLFYTVYRSDTSRKNIYAAIALKKNNNDSVGSTGYLTHGRGTKLMDSISAIFNGLLALKKDNVDSIGPTGYLSHGRGTKLMDSIAAVFNGLLAGKVSNVGGNAASISAGPYLSRPSASNCKCFYWSTDSLFWSYDNTTWGDNKPGSGGGGGGVDSSVVITGGKIAITRGPGTVRVLNTDSLATRLLPNERIIYQSTSWTSGDVGPLLSYNGTGGELTFPGNKIQLTGGTQTIGATTNTAFNKVLKLSGYGGTLLPNVKISTKYKITSALSSSTSGLFCGQLSINALGSLSNMGGYANTTTTGTTGTVSAILGTANLNAKTSLTNLIYNVNDYLLVTVERDYDKVYVTAKNLTTDSPSVTATYRWDASNATNGITPNLPNTANFGWANLGGTVVIDSVCITTTVPYNANGIALGDSKMWYSTPNDISLGSQIMRGRPGFIISAGPTDGIRDINNRRHEIIDIIHPKQALMISVPRNESAFGVAESIWKPALITQDTAMTNNGITCIWTDGVYELQTTQNALTFYIDSAFGSRVIKTKAVNAVSANVSPDQIHESVYGAQNFWRTVDNSGKVVDYAQYLQHRFPPFLPQSPYFDTAYILQPRFDFGSYHPDVYNLGDIPVREGAAFTAAFGTAAQKTRLVVCAASNASMQFWNYTGGNVATTAAFQWLTTVTTGVTPSVKWQMWEDGRIWLGNVTPFRLYHSAANALDFYANGGIAGGTNQNDSTDGGVIPYDNNGNQISYLYGRRGTYTWRVPTSNNTNRALMNLFPGPQLVIGDSLLKPATFILKGGIWSSKDSLEKVTAGGVVYGIGIDSVTGLWKKFTVGAAGATDIIVTPNATNVTIASSTGASGLLPIATSSLAGALDTARAKFIDSLKNRLVVNNQSTSNIGSGGMLSRVRNDSFLIKTICANFVRGTATTLSDSTLNLATDVWGVQNYGNSSSNTNFAGVINLNASITANRTITFTDPGTTVSNGVKLYIVNVLTVQSSSFHWSVTNTLTDLNGNTITQLDDASTYVIGFDGTNYKVFLKSSSGLSYGASTQSGNGSSTSFTIAHGLSNISSTSNIIVTPRTAAAAGIAYVTTDATNITIFYTIAPITGSNNLTWSYSLKP